MSLMFSLVDLQWSTATTNTSLTMNVSGTRPGDLLIVAFSNGGGQTWTPPSGWTAIYDTANGPEATSGSACYYKQAEAGEPATAEWTWGTAQSYISCLYKCTSDTNGASTLVQSNTNVTTTDDVASYSNTAMTITLGNSFIYGIQSEGGTTGITYSSSADTKLFDLPNGGGTPEQAAAWVNQSGTVSGSITRTITPSTANQVAGLVWMVEVHEGVGPHGRMWVM